MARPRSDDKRNAILAAATRVIVREGLGAPTATIAREAGVANGTLFTYFETKSELFNQLYLDIKSGMAAAALAGLPEEGELREQFRLLWEGWMEWAITAPEKRRALALLSVSDELTPETREAGHRLMAQVAALLERVRVNGPMREAPLGFLTAIMNSMVEATMDFVIADPEHAADHRRRGFEALWRAVA